MYFNFYDRDFFLSFDKYTTSLELDIQRVTLLGRAEAYRYYKKRHYLRDYYCRNKQVFVFRQNKRRDAHKPQTVNKLSFHTEPVTWKSLFHRAGEQKNCQKRTRATESLRRPVTSTNSPSGDTATPVAPLKLVESLITPTSARLLGIDTSTTAIESEVKPAINAKAPSGDSFT